MTKITALQTIPTIQSVNKEPNFETLKINQNMRNT